MNVQAVYEVVTYLFKNKIDFFMLKIQTKSQWYDLYTSLFFCDTLWNIQYVAIVRIRIVLLRASEMCWGGGLQALNG